ncbi:MFS transporter [Petrocella atlantisensis]|uniref:MFS transporter n=1 Tax=Petrocella atlantisensis TaxID=2173034 RepID=A0A3P7P318_9FIRM|nr:MFS transporter [Petrocella atlantisensis]VDN47920.1 MFS transporter [Petrocella atlantisensis]
MKQSNFRRYFQFFLIILAAGAIYPVIYLRTNYQVTLLEGFDLSQVQLNNFYSMLGMAYIIGYIPSGLIADKISAKKLIGISLIGVAACGFWFAQIPSAGSVSIIFFLWGIFSVFTFWSSHLKVVKMLSRSNEEGRFFGILDGGRGVVEAVMASIGLGIFAAILGNSELMADKQAAMVAVIYLYSAVVLAAGILILIFVDNDEKLNSMSENSGERSEGEKFHLKDVGKLLKNKYVYLMGGIIFMGYAVFWTVYYIGGFLQSNVGIDAVTVGTITVIILWMRPVGGFIGGFAADRFGRTKTISFALIGAAVFLAVSAMLPVSSPQNMFAIVAVVLGIFLYMIRGTYWSLLGQSKIEVAMMGTAIGVISFIGYLPDIILPQMNNFLWATFGDNGGYNAYFIVSAVFGLLGVVILSVYAKMNSKEKEMEKALEPIQETL